MSARATTRIYRPKDILLFRLPPGILTTNYSGNWVFLNIPTPSARVAVKVSLFFWLQTTGQTLNVSVIDFVDVTLGGILNPFTFWLAAVEQSEAGPYSITNYLFGTNTALQYLPLDNASVAVQHNLSGFSTTVQDTQQALRGQILCPSLSIAAYGGNPAFGLNLSLRVSYEVVGSEMCQDEWDSLVGLMNPIAGPAQILRAA
jgi:hypothetical protein